MRWQGQVVGAQRPDVLPGMSGLDEYVRAVRTPEFAGVTFHEVLARSALNHVPGTSRRMPMAWTINPFRGCQHACRYCFARPTHSYLDLDAGEDFDRQIVVKINVVETLRRELRRPPADLGTVNLGTNTDPYQRAEGRYRFMPGIITALAEARHPLTILTKGTLLRRDLDLLATVAQTVPVSLALSIAVFDEQLQHEVEPGVPSVQARLETVRAAREKGLDVSVFLMPVLPFLTDSAEQLDEALRRIREAGAVSALYTALHLRPGVKEWYFAWLEQQHPELLGRYRELYAKGAYAPKEYRTQLAERIRPLIRRHGLDGRRGSAGTGAAAEPARRGRPAPLPEPLAEVLQPTLF